MERRRRTNPTSRRVRSVGRKDPKLEASSAPGTSGPLGMFRDHIVAVGIRANIALPPLVVYAFPPCLETPSSQSSLSSESRPAAALRLLATTSFSSRSTRSEPTTSAVTATRSRQRPQSTLSAAMPLCFEQAIAHAPSTLPSHASIFTSLLPSHHGASVANSFGVDSEAITLTEILKAEGYATASFNGGIQLDPIYGSRSWIRCLRRCTTERRECEPSRRPGRHVRLRRR